jgi:hypothetical protein
MFDLLAFIEGCEHCFIEISHGVNEWDPCSGREACYGIISNNKYR